MHTANGDIFLSFSSIITRSSTESNVLTRLSPPVLVDIRDTSSNSMQMACYPIKLPAHHNVPKYARNITQKRVYMVIDSLILKSRAIIMPEYRSGGLQVSTRVWWHVSIQGTYQHPNMVPVGQCTSQCLVDGSNLALIYECTEIFPLKALEFRLQSLNPSVFGPLYFWSP